MDLKQWQSQLDSHFTELRKHRAAERPVFALEHGLSEADFLQLQATIRAVVRERKMSADNPLPWVAYAAEVGYQYSGDEYWQTFEANTPGWQDVWDRSWIRSAFLKFHEKFGAAKPVGAWAEHFSIICWPITHAVLPKDLQRQLAQLLYDLRFTFRGEHFESPMQLGQLIAANSWNTSSRFQFLVQSPALVGQIATALLFQDRDLAASLLYAPTLKRIAADLDKERRAREWLLGAKTRAQSVQLAGLQKAGGRPPGPQQEREERRQAAALGIEPALVLQPAANGWSVFLEIPPLSPLQARFPQFGPILSGSRCTVAGSGLRSPLARGRLLYGSQRVPLEKWPAVDDVLLSFEGASKELNHVLKAECLLRPGPTWLFRIQTDGLAYEVRGRTVRPTQTYLVVSENGQVNLGSYGTAVEVDCAGIKVTKLTVPAVMPKELAEMLNRLGLSQACGIEAWPAGIPAAFWDEEGRAEWVYPDIPRIGLRLDHDAQRISARLEGTTQGSCEMPLEKSREHYFIELPPLEPGYYRLAIKPVYADPGRGAVEGFLDVVVREPVRNARALAGSKPPLRVFTDPLQPTVEELWQGDCRIEVAGPRGRSLLCSIDLLERDKDQPILTKSIADIPLPLTAEKCAQLFSEKFNGDTKVQELYDSAHKVRVSFDAEDLGRYTLVAEREFTPLRWIPKREKQKYSIRLIDDSGSKDKASVSRFSFQQPDVPSPVAASNGQVVPSEDGGLYLASIGTHRRAIILPPSRRMELADLRLTPKFSKKPRAPAVIVELVRGIEAWTNAKVPGNILASIWRQKVVDAYGAFMFYVLCGSAWGNAERAHQGNRQRYLAGLRGALATFQELGQLSKTISPAGDDWLELPLEKRCAKMSALLQENRIHRPGSGNGRAGETSWLAEFALRLASAPESLPGWAADNLFNGTKAIFDKRGIACLARYVVITSTLLKPEAQRSWQWR